MKQPSLFRRFILRLAAFLSAVVIITAAGQSLRLCNASAEKKPVVLSLLNVPDGTTEADPSSRVDYWYLSGSNRYFFLPSCFHPEHLMLLIEGAESVQFNGVEYHSGDFVSLKANETITVSGKEFASYRLTIMQSANIPSVFIETESGTTDNIHRKKGAEEPGNILILNQDGQIEYSDQLEYIRTRGNSTFDYPKKPYQIRLKSKVGLLGMGKSKKYILLANYLDRSEIRNTIALDLAMYSKAYAFTPAHRSVDLYINHEYKGCYLLTEKCEIGKTRLNIRDLEEETEKLNDAPLESYPFVGNKHYQVSASRSYSIPNEPEDITGGYLFLANNTDYFQNEASGFVTQKGQAFTIQQPKYASTEQVQYLSGVMQEIENGLFSGDGRDPETGRHFSEILDMESFVNRYLQSEVLNDFDGQRPYFYKDSDSVDAKVYCGPVWDQDNILGASARRRSANYISIENDERRFYYWFPRAMKHPDFKSLMIDTYYSIYRPACQILLGQAEDPDGILRSIDEYTDEIRQSAGMDHTRWGKTLWAQNSGGNTQAGQTPDECAAFLKKFINTHMETMDKAYPR